MRRESDWRTRNNPLHIDLFERSSQSLSSFAPSLTLDMALNDEENVRRRLSDYARHVLQRPVTRIHAPLARNTNFRIDSHVMSMLPIFHGKHSEDPHRHIDELSQVCEISQIHIVSADVMKMKLFPATLRDRAKDWFLTLGKEFTSWIEMEEEFLRKYYSVRKTTSVRKAMHEFTQGSSETFHEAWERHRDLTRECPHHGVSNHELTQIFYDGLGLQDRYLLDAASGGTFMSKFEHEALELIETVAENSHHNAEKPFERGAMLKGGLIDAKSIETGMLLEKIDKMAKIQNLLLDRFHIRNGSEGLVPVVLQGASPYAHCSRLDHVEMDFPIMAIQGQGMYRKGLLGGQSQQGRPNYQCTYPTSFNNPIYNNPMQHQGFRRNTDQTYPPYNTGQQQYSQQQPYANARQSTYIPPQQSYNQAPRPTAPSENSILGAISQFMEQMNRMNSRVDEIQDFVKTNILTLTDNKKGKLVSFSDQLPSQATINPRNQGPSSSQTHNLSHVHVDEEAVEATLVISSLRSRKDLPDPYKDHPLHKSSIDEETLTFVVEQDSSFDDEEERV